MSDELTTVVVYVDPQCPFAWITSRWLQRVERAGLARVRVELMSLACVNEGQDLDPEYRIYNDDAWAAARFSAALLASDLAERWPAFYEAFGRSRHVEGNRDNRANLRMCVRKLDLPVHLLDAADVPSWDDDLRARTAVAVDGVDGRGGTPITRIGTRAYFGPVLTAVPDDDDAVAVWSALDALQSVECFASITTRRSEHLDTGS